MKTPAHSIHATAIKIAWVALTLFLGVLLSVSGAEASGCCGADSTRGGQTAGENQGSCPGCCDAGDAPCGCRAQGSQPVGIPIAALISSGSLHSESQGPAGAAVKNIDGMLCTEGAPDFPFCRMAVAHPPLFLSNQSFLI